jgi:hypothetical protein
MGCATMDSADVMHDASVHVFITTHSYLYVS